MEYVADFTNFAASKNIRVAIVSPVPSIETRSLELCRSQWFRPTYSIHSTCKNIKTNQRFDEHFFKLASNLPKLFVLEAKIPSDNEVIENYFDTSHLSEKGAFTLENQFREFIYNHKAKVRIKPSN